MFVFERMHRPNPSATLNAIIVLLFLCCNCAGVLSLPSRLKSSPLAPASIEKICQNEANAMSRGLLLYMRDKRCAKPGFFASSYNGCPSGVHVCGCLRKQLGFLRAYIPNLARLGAYCRDKLPSSGNTTGTDSGSTDSTNATSGNDTSTGGTSSSGAHADDPSTAPYTWNLRSNGSFIDIKQCPPSDERLIYERCGLYEGKYGYAVLKQELDRQIQELVSPTPPPPDASSAMPASRPSWLTLHAALMVSLGCAVAALLA